MCCNNFTHYNRFWILFLILPFVALTSSPAPAGEQLLPQTAHAYLQTNGPLSEADDGDWWTNVTHGNHPHWFLIDVPPGTDPDFIVQIELFDPESYNTSPTMDTDEQKLNGWEASTFTLYSHDQTTQIHQQVFPGDASTSLTWVPFYDLRVGDYGPGLFYISVEVADDDQNGYKMRIVEADADGNPATGNEIKFMALKTSFQMLGEGSLCDTFYFYVSQDMDTLHLYNFDMDAEVSVFYYDPNGTEYPGTLSGEELWNTGSPDLPTTGGDIVVDPMRGWWGARFCVFHPSPLIDEGNQFIFWPDLPFFDIPPPQTAFIGDYVWLDDNQDGIQDAGENGMADVTVHLLNSDGSITVATTTTDANGYYGFANVDPGTYIVEFVLPPNHFFTAQDQGTDDTLDSDPDPNTGRTAAVTVVAAEVRTDIDAGMIHKKVSNLQIVKEIEGGVYQYYVGDQFVYLLTITNNGPDDAENVQIADQLPSGLQFISADRTQDSGPNPLVWTEPLIGATSSVVFRVTVEATAVGTHENCAFVSSANRDEDLTDNTSCQPVTIIDTPQGSNIQIGDYVWVDLNENGIQNPGEPGLPDVTVNLLSYPAENLVAATTTDGSGLYGFADVLAGMYLLEFILPSVYHFTLPDQGADDQVDSDADPNTGKTIPFTVNDNDTQNFWDAGMIENGTSDLEVTKSIDEERTYYYLGEVIVFNIVVKNLGPDDTYDLSIVDNLPDGLQFVQATRTQDGGPNPLIWNENFLAVGDSLVYSIDMQATDQLGGMDNCVFATSRNMDPDMANNTSCVQVHILVPVELSSFNAQAMEGFVVLRWVTQSETENMGFQIYRSDSENGEYELINSELIPGAGNSSSMNRYKFIDDTGMEPDKQYYYRLADVDYAGLMRMHGPIGIQTAIPDAHVLGQNYPNPFNPETKINFIIKDQGLVELSIYNIRGELVRTLISEKMNAGSHTVQWDGKDDSGRLLTSGMYIYTLRLNNFEQKRTMMFLK